MNKVGSLEQLKTVLMNPILFEWLRLNVEQDLKEESDILITALEYLHNVINPVSFAEAKKRQEYKESPSYKLSKDKMLEELRKYSEKHSS